MECAIYSNCVLCMHGRVLFEVLCVILLSFLLHLWNNIARNENHALYNTSDEKVL